MKLLHAEAGGRPRANDDLMALQELTRLYSGGPLLRDFPTCVLSGCVVTARGNGRYDVGSGVVAIGATGGAVYDFLGAQDVELPAAFTVGPADMNYDRRPYQTGGTKTCISQQFAVLEPVAAGAVFALDAEGPVFWYDHVADRTRAVGVVEFGVFDLTGYDSTGKGLGRNRGWGLCNGQHGTANLQGRFPLAYNADVSALRQLPVGTAGGAETHTLSLTEMPRHNHNYPMWNHNQTSGNSGYPETAGPASPIKEEGGTTYDTGGGQAHNNMPPYYVLAARQWIGL